MSIIKSFDVGNGDMFYIKHDNDDFTVIDCYLDNSNKGRIIKEIREQSKKKTIHRFFSTHPDEDHIHGIEHLKGAWDIPNFYCVENQAKKSTPTESFETYCTLRDSPKAYYIHRGCHRKWLNQGDSERDGSDLHILWPKTTNPDFIKELEKIKKGDSPNNLSPIIHYRPNNGASFMWLGDLETSFMEKISSGLKLPKANILFAPHHGRDSGTIPKELLEQINPDIIVIGSAPCGSLNYYEGYLTITQNSAGDITFNTSNNTVHVYCSKPDYPAELRQKADGRKTLNIEIVKEIAFGNHEYSFSLLLHP